MTIRAVGNEPADRYLSNMTNTRNNPLAFATQFTLVDKALLTSAIVSALLLVGAHIFQALGYEPCALCLDQREAHWTTLTITLAGLVSSIWFKAPLLAAAASGAAALVYAFGASLAFYHTGVEFGFWPGPPSCSGSEVITSITDLSSGFDPDKPRVACDRVAWKFLGISMAGYNLLASAGLFALTLIATGGVIRTARRKKRS